MLLFLLISLLFLTFRQAFMLALIEGFTLAVQKYQADAAKPRLEQLPEDPLGPPPATAHGASY